MLFFQFCVLCALCPSRLSSGQSCWCLSLPAAPLSPSTCSHCDKPHFPLIQPKPLACVFTKCQREQEDRKIQLRSTSNTTVSSTSWLYIQTILFALLSPHQIPS